MVACADGAPEERSPRAESVWDGPEYMGAVARVRAL